MARVFLSVLTFDLKTIARDQFLYLLLFIIVFFYGLFAVIGVNREALGVEDWRQWIPYILILSIITNPSSFGMLFGFVLIEEVETRVRAALLTTPVAPIVMLAMRTPLTIVMLTITALGLVAVMNSAWGAPAALALHQWFALSLLAAYVGAVVMVSVATVAGNRVEALALGKFYSGLTAPPALLYLLPADAWQRHLFVVFPTTPIVNAYEAFRQGADGGWAWLAGGAAYATLLMALVVRRYLRKSFALA